MKRSPIKRSDPDKIRAWQAKSRRTAARNRMRSTAEREVWQTVLDGIAVRARGECEAVKAPGPCAGPLDGHHIQPRSKGGRDVPSNALLVCRQHHDWIHSHPIYATDLGYLRGVVR